MNGRIRKIQIAVGTLALLFALVLGAGGNLGTQSASALTIGTDNGGWNPDNFASSCKAAGGHLIEIDQGDIKYSKCVFSDGSVNKCDWIKKICTFGIVAGPFKDRLNVVNGTLTTTGTTSGGGTTTTTTSRTTSGTLLLAKDR